MIVLAGDIGGTNTRLALIDCKAGEASGRPIFTTVAEQTYPSAAHGSLDAIAEIFLAAHAKGRAIDRACFGIAGPVENNICRATNLPWVIDGRAIAAKLGIARVILVNDFYAAALGVAVVSSEHLVPLGGGPPIERGPIVVLGAGTGLGEAFLIWSPTDDRYQVISSEGGHTDFPARTALEIALLQYLTTKYGRASCERVLSGQGLIDIFGFLSQEPSCQALIRPETTAALGARQGGDGHDPAAVISQRGLSGSDPICELALAMFCNVLGAVAGNLGLSLLATGGVFVAGGIAPRVLPYLQKGGFREAFERKGRLHPLVAKLPAFVVTHPQLGLLGAAKVAAGA
jgi:glucokinase